jgi:hypothetical protein
MTTASNYIILLSGTNSGITNVHVNIGKTYDHRRLVAGA